MGFKLAPDGELYDADGIHIGTWGDAETGVTLNLRVTASGDEALEFINAVAEAYERVRPPAHYHDVEFAPDSYRASEPQTLLEWQIKTGKRIIRVHMSDADGFPSDLHGHDLERPQEKIDIYTGEVWNAKQRRCIGRLDRKTLKRIHDALREQTTWGSEKLARREAGDVG
jgi:hypothetical protein